MPVLEIETRDFVRVLRLNRPERKNALTSELGWAIVEAVEDAARDDSVRVIAITGNGDAFCSGLDLGPDDGAKATTGLIAARQTKRMLGRATTPFDLEAFLRDEIANARRGLRTDDGLEAVNAIREKRAPVFKGR